MAVLYGHILNPLKQVTLRIRYENLDTRACDGVQEGDLSMTWICSVYINKFLQDMSHLLECLSSGASDDISCGRKHSVYFSLYQLKMRKSKHLHA